MIDTQYPTNEFKDKAKGCFLSFWEELQVRIFQTWHNRFILDKTFSSVIEFHFDPAIFYDQYLQIDENSD